MLALLVATAPSASIARSPSAPGPIIGVLTEPAPQCSQSNGTKGSCFSSLYVKWLEAAGARVAPIPFDASPERLRELHASVNAVLFTGGGLNLTTPSSQHQEVYEEAARLLFDLSMDEHAKTGASVPIWGTCMGFQLITLLTASSRAVLSEYAYDAEDLSLALELTDAANASRIFAALPSEAVRDLRTESITTNLHHDGVKPSAFENDPKLKAFWDVLSTNVDRDGLPFVSTIEARGSAPAWGVQWHPERNQFEFDTYKNIAHTPSSIRAMQAVAAFLVSQSELNDHRFESKAAEEAVLIYNFRPSAEEAYSSAHYYFPPTSQK